jgi:NAD(P)H-nitrite reductase large subunit
MSSSSSERGPLGSPGSSCRPLFSQRPGACRKKDAKNFVCFCQGISRDEIVQSIEGGATTLEDLQDQIGATVGPCGGSCTPNVLKLLRDTLAGAPSPCAAEPEKAAPAAATGAAGALADPAGDPNKE